MKLIRLLLAFHCVINIALAQNKLTTFPNDPIHVIQFKLDNGLTVYLTENHDLPQVFGAVVVKTGGKKDPADNTGMAHYLEHMLFKGTTDLGTINYEKEKVLLDQINVLYDELGKTSDPKERGVIQQKINQVSVEAAAYSIPNEMDRMISEIGGENVNAFTTEEMTAYFNSFPSNQMERWLDIYAHRFEEPVFRLFQSELETVYEEKNISMDDPFNAVFEKFMKSFYKNHPYGQQTVIGKTEHLKNPSLTAMYDYYNKWYVANNMALVLSGDFNSQEIIPIVKEKFGKWRSAPVPEFPEYKEEEFKGKEIVKTRSTPVKVGAMGYRVPALRSNELEVMYVMFNMLTNNEGAGKIDLLGAEGKLMSAFCIPLINNDYGAMIIGFIPKIIGQSLKKAEKIVLAEIEKIKAGDFDKELLDASKNSLRKEIEKSWETNEERVLLIGTSFIEEKSWGDYLDYTKRINNVTKEQVVLFANKYFGENRLVMYSKMGFPKKDKLDKPKFEPVIPKEGQHSPYYEQWKKIPAGTPKINYMDFSNDIQLLELTKGVTLKKASNPFNEICDLKFRFGTGKYYIPELKFIPEYVDIANSTAYTSSAFKRKLFDLGFSFSAVVLDNELFFNLEGFEENLESAVAVLYQHISGLQADDKKLEKIRNDTEAELKISKRQPGFFARVLMQKVLLGDNSPYLKEISAGEMKKLKSAVIIEKMKEAMQYECTINFTGNKDIKLVADLVQNNFTFSASPLAKKERVIRERKPISENTIYLMDFKKAVQSQIYFLIDGRKTSIEDQAVVDAFNNYFGGDMSSLVFQEIREFRSLAYATYANYTSSQKQGEKSIFFGYIGCQSDKTNDAVDAMHELIRNMPLKSERWEGIRSSLIQSALSEKPDFRSLISTIENLQYRGYSDDPRKILIPAYEKMNFEDVTQLWESDIRQAPMAVALVGNFSKINLEALKKYGTVVIVKESDIMKK